MTRSRTRLVRLILLGCSLVFSLLVAELAIRRVRPQAVMTVTPGLYQPDPPRRYRIAPGFEGRITNQVEFDTTVRTNHAGMRGAEIVTKPAGFLRVLALGDSFTFGVGAGEYDTWPVRLERQVPNIQVLNAGAPGFGVPDEVAWFEAHGVGLQPDAVVVAVFLANDLQDASPDQPKVAVVDGSLVVPGETGGLRRWLYYHSHLFRLLKSSVLEGRLRSLLGLKEPWAKRELRAELSLYGPTLPEEMRKGAEATEAAVARLASRGVPAVAVLIPSLPQVDPGRWTALLEQFGLYRRSRRLRSPPAQPAVPGDLRAPRRARSRPDRHVRGRRPTGAADLLSDRPAPEPRRLRPDGQDDRRLPARRGQSLSSDGIEALRGGIDPSPSR